MIERVARKIHQPNRYVVNSIGKDAMYHLQNRTFDISDVEKELVSQIPTALQMGKVYQRLIRDTSQQNENYFEPSYVIAKAYQANGF